MTQDLVNGKLVLVTPLELPSIFLRHTCVKMRSPSHGDQNSTNLASYSHSAFDIGVVSGILDVLGHGNAWFCASFPILGILNVDRVEVATLRVVEDIARRGYVLFFVFNPGVVIYGADAFGFFFDHEVGTTGELWGRRFFWGVVWD